MEAIVNFFERLVSEFSWRRVGLLVAVLVLGIVGFWVYEAFTGHFRANRMQFAAEQLARLSDPELRKNVHGDPDLEAAHNQMKTNLRQFAEGSQFDLGVPEPVLKALAALAPWLLLSLLLFCIAEPSQFRSVFGGTMLASVPFVIVGVILPIFHPTWINYFLYPIGSTLLTVLLLIAWQKQRDRTAS